MSQVSIANSAVHTTILLDQNAQRFQQLMVVALCIFAMVFSLWPMVAGLAIVLLVGSRNPNFAVLRRVYTVLRLVFGLRQRLEPDDPRPHNFAQLLGGMVLAASALAWGLGLTGLGMALAGVVVALALLNLVAGVCVGCLLYFQWRQLQYRLRRV
jgi:drug/metabolite transporter (DMT)-like permease